jgi:hypothetical protein
MKTLRRCIEKRWYGRELKNNSDIDEEVRVSGIIIPERERERERGIEKRNKIGWVTTNSELLPPHFAALRLPILLQLARNCFSFTLNDDKSVHFLSFNL